MKKYIPLLGLFLILMQTVNGQVNQYDALKKVVKNIADIEMAVNGKYLRGNNDLPIKMFFNDKNFDVFFDSWKGYLSCGMAAEQTPDNMALLINEDIDFSTCTRIGANLAGSEFPSNDIAAIYATLDKPISGKVVHNNEVKPLTDISVRTILILAAYF